MPFFSNFPQYSDENCIGKIVCHQPKISTVDLQSNFTYQQECIPVGCVLPTCCPYLPACTAPRGIWSGGYLVLGVDTWPWVCTWSWRGTWSWGVYLVWRVLIAGGVPGLGGVPGPGGIPDGGTCPGLPPL